MVGLIHQYKYVQQYLFYHFRLGGLYSAIENDFLPGMELWDLGAINEIKHVIHHPSALALWTSPQTLKEKYDLLNINLSGSLSVMLSMGKIEASGSFAYLSAKKVY